MRRVSLQVKFSKISSLKATVLNSTCYLLHHRRQLYLENTADGLWLLSLLLAVVPTRRRAWLPIPVFLMEYSHGQRSLAGYSPQGRTESDMTEMTRT